MARRFRRRKMTDTELRVAVERAISQADFFDNSEVSENFQAALNSYLGRNQGASIPGSADERSNDVADMIESVTSQILPAFKSDELAVFEADGPEDIEQARVESKIVNQQLFDMNDGELEIQAAIRDALLLRNAIMRCEVREEVDTRQESFKDLSAIEFQAVQAPENQNQTVQLTSVEEGGEANSVDVRLTRTTRFRKLTLEAIDPVNFVIEREWTSVNPQEANIVGERSFEMRGDLLAEGFPRKKVEQLKSTDSDTTLGALARNRNQSVPRWDIGDASMERIEVYRLYMRVDWDGDGIAERRHIIYAGGTSGGAILRNDPHSFVPYAVGVPFLYPHRFQGISVFDKLESLENVKSRALSQYVDNLENSNFPELVIADGAVAEGDVTTRKTSGVIRADSVDAVRALPVQDIGRSSLGFLSYMDKIRSERTGSALDLTSAEAQIAGESAYGIERLVSPREMIANMIADTLGATLVKQLFKLIHMQLRLNFPGRINWHVGQSEFINLDAGSWQSRDKIRVTAGMSEHQRGQTRAVLEQHLLQQEKLFTAGLDGVLMDLDTYYEVLIAWSKAGGLMTPRRFWIDPQTPEAQQARQQKQQQAQQQQQQEAALQERLFSTQVQVSKQENQTDLVKHLTDLRFRYWDRTLNSEIEELRIEAQGSETADPDAAQIDADQEQGREQS